MGLEDMALLAPQRQLPIRLPKSVLALVLALPGLAGFHAVGWKG